jgi:gentisate 1,2-dioxygenase
MQANALDTPERLSFYAKIDKKNLTPLWQVLGALITPEPRSMAFQGYS